jgi:threonine dehydrogenase-like Zn-dependent dehydrogenase
MANKRASDNTSTGTQCQALVLPDYNQALEVRNFNIPDVEDGGLVVKIERATICGTDHHITVGALAPISKTPCILGHEMVGIIEAQGKGREVDVAGTPLAIGDRVIWAYAYCGRCYYCAVVNQPTLCSNFTPYGYADASVHPHIIGGFSQYNYILPNCHVVRVPDPLPGHWASSASCALRTIMHASDRLGGIRPSDTVVVQGSGPVGLYGVAVSRAMGAKTVINFGAPEGRLEVATAFGADRIANIETTDNAERLAMVMELTNGRGADVIFECSGSHFAQEEAFSVIRPGGRIAFIGAGDPQPLSLPGMAFIGKQVMSTGIRSAGVSYYREALDFMVNQQHNFDFDLMFGDTYGLGEIPEAMEKMARLEEIKPIVDPFKN